MARLLHLEVTLRASLRDEKMSRGQNANVRRRRGLVRRDVTDGGLNHRAHVPTVGGAIARHLLGLFAATSDSQDESQRIEFSHLSLLVGNREVHNFLPMGGGPKRNALDVSSHAAYLSP